MEDDETIRRGGHIPQEIVEEILVKLPVRSLVRFKAVLREWRRTIESKCFQERHIGFQKSHGGRQARILALSIETRYNRLIFDILLISTNNIARKSSPYRPMTPFHWFQDSKICQPCDGLLGLYSDTHMSIFNPATTCCRSLPYPTASIPYDQRRHHTLLGIGRENCERGRYKVMCYFECDNKKVCESTKCIVFALDTNTWKDVDPPHCRLHYDHSIVHLDGVLYCFSHGHTESENAKVLAFDLHTYKFQSLSITSCIGFRYSRYSGMHNLNHRLCIFNSDTLFRIWGLDINSRSWEMMQSIDCSRLQLKNWIFLFPIARINDYFVIITDCYRHYWGLYDSKNHILYRTSFIGQAPPFGMPYFETLVSAYQ
ncbi:hypothetical protein CARUB_v10011369mg [Capsella rubella]|uniref:F-box domain-containing protein n=1 Tax=Capsella rubella TaxID=81985 RepID=R0GSR1_9BRAS|nr:putative F-box protein At2g02030 [Capsella rubella]EOA38952.1 hypothetical protein CARUB_v10011369mg [Capsella rubella]